MHGNQNNKQSKTYVHGLRPFGNTLPRGVKGILKKNGYNYSEIISKWNLIVGKNISDYCSPKSIKIKRENRDGIIILLVKRGDEINIEYSKNEIISKVNSYFGYKLINEVKLQTLNNINKKNNYKNIILKSKKNFKEKISKIKNKDIRDSLSELLDAANK